MRSRLVYALICLQSILVYIYLLFFWQFLVTETNVHVELGRKFTQHIASFYTNSRHSQSVFQDCIRNNKSKYGSRTHPNAPINSMPHFEKLLHPITGQGCENCFSEVIYLLVIRILEYTQLHFEKLGS